MFEGARDITLERREINVTTDKTGEDVHLPAINECNVLVEVSGLEGNTSLSIRFEESDYGGTDYNEIATFPVSTDRHGILFAKEKDYIRYSLIVSGTDPDIDVTIKF